MKNTYQDEETPALLLSPVAPHEAQQDQDRPDGDAEEAHIDKLHSVGGEGAQDLQEGAPVHAHPDAHGQEGGSRQLERTQGWGVIIKYADLQGQQNPKLSVDTRQCQI